MRKLMLIGALVLCTVGLVAYSATVPTEACEGDGCTIFQWAQESECPTVCEEACAGSKCSLTGWTYSTGACACRCDGMACPACDGQEKAEITDLLR